MENNNVNKPGEGENDNGENSADQAQNQDAGRDDQNSTGSDAANQEDFPPTESEEEAAKQRSTLNEDRENARKEPEINS